MSLFEVLYGAKVVESAVDKARGRKRIIDSNIKKDRKLKSDSFDIEEIDNAFAYISRELPEYIVDQKEYLTNLVLAFKRPFLQQQSKTYKNMIFVFGPKGSGRKYSIQVIAKMLSIKGLTKESSIYYLDFSKYDTDESIDRLLLPDLYKAFNGKSPIVILENFDLSCALARDCIVNLGINGAIKLEKRFVWKNGKLAEATGSYEKESTDSFSANGKYIVLISSQSSDKMSSLFPQKFLTEIADVISTKKLSQDALLEITDSKVEDCAAEIKERCGFTLEYSRSFLSDFVGLTVHHSGAHDIINAIQNDLYKPITELALKNQLVRGSIVSLSLENGIISANTIELSNLKASNDTQELAALKEELDDIIGLQSVKDFIVTLEEHVIFEKKSRSSMSLSLHMIFTGNPGTGKTTVARLIARYLKGLGCLSSGQLVEVTRSDLVGQYMGQTAQKTAAKIKTAIGGVLFIDEAYSLVRNKEDFFGLEAVDTIVKYMEDYRDDLVVILAGYEKEMNDFLEVNSGLKSRFNYVVDFPDYTPKEMLQIADVVAKKRNYTIDEHCLEGLQVFFTNTQSSLKKDAGNGRLVRNVVETAIINHSRRMASVNEYENNPELYKLTEADFNLSSSQDESVINELDKELEQIIGLASVKEFVQQLKSHIEFSKHSNDTSRMSFHMIFCGNPGTGKTTIARIIAKYFKAFGILSEGQLVEASRADLVAGFQGQTAIKTSAVIESALGGVLFIDEAYSVVRDEQDAFGHEAIDTLVKAIEDYRENFVVILAGYTKEMNEFLKSNSGLRSRFNHIIEFPDYNADEMVQITTAIADNRNYSIDEECIPYLREYYIKTQNEHKNESGNGRLARNTVEKAILTHAQQIAKKGFDNVSDDDLHMLSVSDFGFVEKKQLDFDLETELVPIVGLEPVKEYLRSLYAVLRINKERKERGIAVNDNQTLHMVFTGNPGTGKTTMARIVSKLLNSMEILPTDKLIEVDRSSLVAGYVGQTALKTQEVLEQARGGVLFVDEAYSLSQGGENDFGREAIDTMVKYMEDHRNEIVVILAGYTENMQSFLTINPGLKSRFPTVIEFPNYSPDELLDIISRMYSELQYSLGEGVSEKLLECFEQHSSEPHFGNGRFARNLCEKSIRNLSLRVSKQGIFNDETLTTLLPEDIVL